MKSNWYVKAYALFVSILFCITAWSSVIVTSMTDDYELPSSLNIDMSVEDCLMKRLSIREFTRKPVPDELLATVLWAAYGLREDKLRTVNPIDGTHSVVLYVLKHDAVYTYDPLNHSLVFYKDEDYRDIAGWQYEAPIQLGLAWDLNKSSDDDITAAEMGEIGQNICFAATALGLGTVVTGERPSPLDLVGLPSNHVGGIVMPLGYPENSPDFRYRPRWLSLLPRIRCSGMDFSTALNERTEATSFGGSLTRQEISHLIWASYGFSYYLEKIDREKNPIERHRTTPSAHGYYPLRVYAVTENGVYRYIPGLVDFDKWGLPIVTFMVKIKNGDFRQEIGQASNTSASSAPMIIIPVLDIEKTNKWDDLSSPAIRWVWYFEAGAAAHNVCLEATALGLSSNIFAPTDTETILEHLRLDDDYLPLLVVPIGS